MSGIKRTFGREAMRNYDEAIRREWVITNGLGSYAGSSIIGANTRKHHGLFIASLHAPTDRRVLVNRICEEVIRDGNRVSLFSGRKSKGVEEQGFLNQVSFSMGAVPVFTYFTKGLWIEKTLAYEWEKNTVAIRYRIKNRGDKAVLRLKPVYNYRDHNDGSQKKDLVFVSGLTEEGFSLTPDKNRELTLRTYVSEGSFGNNSDADLYDKNIELQTEIDTGMSSSDTGYMPIFIDVSVPEETEKDVSVVFTIEKKFERDASKTIKAAKRRCDILIENSGVRDKFSKSLVAAADRFIVRRASTKGKTILAGLPWFTDWGRDTMISLTGLTLVTGRFEDAKSILRTFVEYEKNGLLPNMFPDKDCEPIYNTADASLWFFYCVHKYLEYVKSEEAFKFVEKELYPCMKKIIKAYKDGTDFSIGMDADGLIRAGDDLDQVTWMDVRVGDKVMTPRHGKPVEINALWYNALCIMKELSKRFGDKSANTEYSMLVDIVRDSFEQRFYNKAEKCLYDVVDEKSMKTGEIYDDDRIRPNQIWAVSLPFCALSKDQAKCVVDTVYKKLYTDFGLRTLDPEDPDYHGLYKGELSARDEAYHQGTAWAFIMGGFITAFLKVYPDQKETAELLLAPLKQHLNEGCIGGIAEVFDGDPPHISGGCYTQAWSVGEILRAVAEGGLKV